MPNQPSWPQRWRGGLCMPPIRRKTNDKIVNNPMPTKTDHFGPSLQRLRTPPPIVSSQKLDTHGHVCARSMLGRVQLHLNTWSSVLTFKEPYTKWFIYVEQVPITFCVLKLASSVYGPRWLLLGATFFVLAIHQFSIWPDYSHKITINVFQYNQCVQS
jgi:hypothetical protein